MPALKSRPRIFYGWWIVAACFFIAVYTGGIVHFGFTAIFEPIRNEFGWSYTQISLAASLRGLEMGLLAPLVGLVVDRWGPRKLLLIGSFIIGLGLILLSYTTSLLMFYAIFFIMAIGSSNCGSTVKYTAVANWFRKRIGIASGIVAAGFGVGGFLIPLVTTVIDKFDWRMAMVIFGIGMWCIGIPLALLVRHKPEQYGYLPDGDAESPQVNNEDTAPVHHEEIDSTAKQAIKSPTFWFISLALMCQILMSTAVVTHVMPYLDSIGFDRTTASFIAMTIPIASVIGRLGFGFMGDIFNKRQLAAVAFTLMGLGLALFALIPSGGIAFLVISIISFGTGWGANSTMRPALLREYFGRSQFGSIHGFTVGVLQIGIMAGPALAGWAFDSWGSYQGIWFIFAGVSIAAGIAILNTPPLRVKKADTTTDSISQY